jgi:hypothetical protein
MLLCIECGRRIGLRQVRRRGAVVRSTVGVVDGSVYGLLALLIGFTFSGAAGRFDQRRALIVTEANAASTAWQRIDLLPVQAQPPLRAAMRGYMDALIDWYGGAPVFDAVLTQPPSLTRAQNALWGRSVEASLAPGGETARLLLIPSLNEMFDTVDFESAARRLHPPVVIWLMLLVTALAAGLFAGYGLAAAPRNWLYIVGLAASVSISTYVILELEYPRLGFTRISAADQLLVELRATFD